ncbi:MAG: THUMP domain-containing protein [bacterium]|nr:THUMP domain-containing protein [bacterium]
MYQYQQTECYFAQIAEGCEEAGGRELGELGAVDVHPVYRGIHFKADQKTLYTINYGARLPTRILAPLITFDCHSTRYLQKTARTIPWEDFIRMDQTFAVNANVANSKIRHSRYAALCLKDAVVDGFRGKFGQRPSIDTIHPDLWINLHLQKNRATISIDTSGGSLHRRRYREQSVEAPLLETVAAAIIGLTEWDGSRPLYDPLCGSGTLIAEALIAYCHIPAGYLRPQFGFERLPDFDPRLWVSVQKEMQRKIRPLPRGLIGASDISPEAVKATATNLRHLPFGDGVDVKRTDFRAIETLENTVIISNPPYGIRMQAEPNLGDFYRQLGDFLKQRCHGATAYIYFGNREMIGSVGLRPSWKKPLSNGGLDGRLVKYELY